MTLSSRDTLILQEIIDLRGHCLFSARCAECPFRSKCLPEFLNVVPPSQNQRMNMAIDVIAYQDILGDSSFIEEVKSSNGNLQNHKRSA